MSDLFDKIVERISCDIGDRRGLGGEWYQIDHETKLDIVKTWKQILMEELNRDNLLTCVYCGHAYPPGTPTHGSPILTAHIETCEKHPMFKLKQELKAAQLLVERSRANAAWAPPYATHRCSGKCGMFWDCRFVGETNNRCQRCDGALTPVSQIKSTSAFTEARIRQLAEERDEARKIAADGVEKGFSESTWALLDNLRVALSQAQAKLSKFEVLPSEEVGDHHGERCGEGLHAMICRWCGFEVGGRGPKQP